MLVTVPDIEEGSGRDLRAAGCPVGLAVDGSASNDSSNLLAELRQIDGLGRAPDDEFLLCLPEMNEAEVVQRLRQVLRLTAAGLRLRR